MRKNKCWKKKQISSSTKLFEKSEREKLKVLKRQDLKESQNNHIYVVEGTRIKGFQPPGTRRRGRRGKRRSLWLLGEPFLFLIIRAWSLDSPLRLAGWPGLKLLNYRKHSKEHRPLFLKGSLPKSLVLRGRIMLSRLKLTRSSMSSWIWSMSRFFSLSLLYVQHIM